MKNTLLAPVVFSLALVSAPVLAQDAADAAPVAETTEAPVEATVEAPVEAPSASEVIDEAKGVYSSVEGGEWLLALGFLGMLIGSIGRWLGSLKWKFWSSKAGGYVTAGVAGVAILGGGLVDSGGAFSLELLVLAAVATLTAMGLHGPAKALKGLVKKPAA